MLGLMKKGNVQIDGRRNLNLSLKILKYVNEDSRIYNAPKTDGKLDAFDGEEPERVFLHYVNLIDAGFIKGHYDIQNWAVSAYYLTWAGHDLLDHLQEKAKPQFLR